MERIRLTLIIRGIYENKINNKYSNIGHLIIKINNLYSRKWIRLQFFKL